jgi:uncharacterized membrane protein
MTEQFSILMTIIGKVMLLCGSLGAAFVAFESYSARREAERDKLLRRATSNQDNVR